MPSLSAQKQEEEMCTPHGNPFEQEVLNIRNQLLWIFYLHSPNFATLTLHTMEHLKWVLRCLLCVDIFTCFVLARKRTEMGEVRLCITDNLNISTFQQDSWNYIIPANLFSFFFPPWGHRLSEMVILPKLFILYTHISYQRLNSALPCFWHAIFFSVKLK